MAKTETGASARGGPNALEGPEPDSDGRIDAGAVYVNLPLAAHMLGLGTDEMRCLVEAGQIESVCAGAARLVPVSAIRRYLRRHRALHTIPKEPSG